MEKEYNNQDLGFSAVFEVIGEPAVVINGVPDLTPGGNLDAASSPRDGDPCFDEWLEGRKIQKLFGDQYYSGRVERYDSETNWYRVVYEDGDFEDLEWHELEVLLLPLDISIPLTVLASDRCKAEKSVAGSRRVASMRKNRTNSLRSNEKTSVLLQLCEASDPKGGKHMEAHFDRKTHQDTSQLQNGLQPENKGTFLQMSQHDETVSFPGGYMTTLNICSVNDSDFAPVFEVIGEPAIVIKGVPAANPCCTPTILSTMDAPEPGDGVCFHEWLEGRKVKKLFGDQYYLGKVEKFDKETNWYRVVYEDGDFEDLEWHELADVIVPLDISVPITTLAAHVCKSEGSEPRIKHIVARKNHTDKLERTVELGHTSHVGELHDRKPAEEYVCERTNQENLQMKKEFLIENTERCLQIEKPLSNSGEGTTTLNMHLNEESMDMMMSVFQTPERAYINGDELILGDAHSEAFVQEGSKWQRKIQKQSGKTSRAEKQRRKENSFVHNSVYHSG